MKCMQCGADLANTVKFCTKCGYKIPEQPIVPPAQTLLNTHASYTRPPQPRAPYPPGSRPNAAPADDIAHMQQKLNSATITGALKTSGTSSIIFGVLALLLGMMSVGQNIFNIILAAIGVMLIVEGIYITVVPSAFGLLIDGLAVCAIGVWNIIITFINIANGHHSSFIIILGGYQLVYGVKRISAYKESKNTPLLDDTDPAVLEAKQLINSIRKAKPAANPDIIALSTVNSIDRVVWKAKLLDNKAILVNTPGTKAIVERKHNITIASPQAGTKKKQLKMQAAVGPATFKGAITASDYNKFLAWKSQGA